MTPEETYREHIPDYCKYQSLYLPAHLLYILTGICLRDDFNYPIISLPLQAIFRHFSNSTPAEGRCLFVNVGLSDASSLTRGMPQNGRVF
jgi:hypothetical protein